MTLEQFFADCPMILAALRGDDAAPVTAREPENPLAPAACELELA